MMRWAVQARSSHGFQCHSYQCNCGPMSLRTKAKERAGFAVCGTSNRLIDGRQGMAGETHVASDM